MSPRLRRRRLCALIGCASLGAGIGMIAPPIVAASASPPALFSVLAHDSLARSVATPTCEKTGQLGLYDCAEIKLRALDRQLDATAEQILVAEKPDETGPNPDVTATQATNDLSAAQQTWLAFRNADCLAQLVPGLNGNGIGLEDVGCALADGHARLAGLQHDLKGLQP
jgi:uncharacterized protein YecT (DUF1311 family)